MCSLKISKLRPSVICKNGLVWHFENAGGFSKTHSIRMVPFPEAMDYERRLLLAANLILSRDRSDEPPPEPYELGITAALKPHQIEGLSWLIRRYHLGVNVVLGGKSGIPSSDPPYFLISPLPLMCLWVSLQETRSVFSR